MADTTGAHRLVLTFSPLPQHAWSQDRELANDDQAVRSLRDWGDHLARAIRTADLLRARGWRLTLMGDVVVAEKHAHREELASLARELKDDLRALTVSAEAETEHGEGYLTLEDDEIPPRGWQRFRPLIDQ
jgi:hypothetical protein